jgi:HPt (histidine-containing phosphotransfer) domain-containing protein
MMQQDGGRHQTAERFAVKELLERVDGDEELLREVIAIYLEDTPTVLEALKEGLGQNLPDAVAKAAHTLKGASANIAANRLHGQAYQLERQARAGDLKSAAAIYEALEQEFEALKRHLNQYLADSQA